VTILLLGLVNSTWRFIPVEGKKSLRIFDKSIKKSGEI
jgi:hypothetical protein